MGTSAEIRPLGRADVRAAAAVAWRALAQYYPDTSDPAVHERITRRGEDRVAHCLATDPAGAWVAEREGAVVGVALAICREGVWGLSLLAVDPARQGAGVGPRLLAAALAHGDGEAGPGLIVSSSDPRAMRAYHRAGFRLLPAIEAAGPVNASRIPAGLRSRPGDPEADRSLLDAASRRARGASHAADLPVMLAAGGSLLVHDDGGFAVEREGSPLLLAAGSEAIAADLLWSCLAAAAPGATVGVDTVTAGHDWAIAVALEAGLSLTPGGGLFVRGAPGALAPYLPSGAYL